MNDRGIYKYIAPYARVFKTEAVTYIEVQKGIYCDRTVSYTFLVSSGEKTVCLLCILLQLNLR